MDALPSWQIHKISKESLDKFIQPSCAESKLRAERRAGEILADMKPKPGKPKSLHNGRISKSRLNDLGVKEKQSHRWQAVAGVSEKNKLLHSTYSHCGVKVF